MKKSFLALVKEVKDTGIANTLCHTTNPKELKDAWKKFEEENPVLFYKVKDWASKYDYSPLFAEGEEFQDPVEIAVVIRIIDDYDISECEIFEECDDLTHAIEELPGVFAEGLGKILYHTLICEIIAESIFAKKE